MTNETRPAEYPAADELKTALIAFNENTPERKSVTAEDREQIIALARLARQFHDAATRAWTPAKSLHSLIPPHVAKILGRITLLRETAAAVEVSPLGAEFNHELAGLPHHRAGILRLGETIVAEIDRAIAAAFERDAKRDAGEIAIRDQVAFWFQHPAVKALIEALEFTSVTWPDFKKPTDSIVTAIGNLMDVVNGDRRREGLDEIQHLRTVAGTWREWLPVASELLANSDDRSETAA